jgi:hypothetical protein
MRLPLNSKEFSKGGMSSSLGGFWDNDDSGLIAKSWDWNSYDLAIKTFSSCSGDDSFSSSRNSS